jgi:hypothetical protein
LKYFGGCRTRRYYGYPPLHITNDKGTLITTVIEYLGRKKRIEKKNGKEKKDIGWTRATCNMR